MGISQKKKMVSLIKRKKNKGLLTQKSKPKNFSKKKNKSSRKKSQKKTGGAYISPQDREGSNIIIKKNSKWFGGVRAQLGKFNKDTQKYSINFLNIPKEYQWSEPPELGPDEFDYEEKSFQTKKIEGNYKIYVLWIVNCNSCKLSTLPHCSKDGIYETYNYYKNIQDIYTKLTGMLKEQGLPELSIKVFCSILLRSQETSKLLAKGIQDNQPELYQKIKTPIVTMNHCQEIQRFETSLNTIYKHIKLLNSLIPDTLLINDSAIMGVEDSLTKLTESDKTNSVEVQQKSETPETKDNLSEINRDNSLIRSQNTSNMESLDAVNNIQKDTSTSIENSGVSNKLPLETTTENTVAPNKLSPEVPSQPELPPDLKSLDNNPPVTSNELPPKGGTDVSNSPENNNLAIKPPESNQTGGGFFDFITKYFSGSDSKSPNEMKTNFVTHADDYQKWKQQILPFLDNQDLNIVISHGKYIKRNVLNNNSLENEFTANNLDGFLLEYNLTDGDIRQINFLDSDLKPTVIAQSPPNQIPFKPTIGNMKKTEIVWEKITQNSKLPPEIIKKYSKCLLK